MSTKCFKCVTKKSQRVVQVAHTFCDQISSHLKKKTTTNASLRLYQIVICRKKRQKKACLKRPLIQGVCLLFFSVPEAWGEEECAARFLFYFHFPPIQTTSGISQRVKLFLGIRPTLMGTKNLHENGPNPFFFFFFSILWENKNGPDSYSQIRLSVS